MKELNSEKIRYALALNKDDEFGLVDGDWLPSF
jgi:hypothetical protein